MKNKKVTTAIRRTMAAVMLCAFLFSTGASVYAEGDMENGNAEETLQSDEPKQEVSEEQAETKNEVEKKEQKAASNELEKSEETGASNELKDSEDPEKVKPETDDAKNEIQNPEAPENANNPEAPSTPAQGETKENEKTKHTEHTWGSPVSNEDGTHTFKCTEEECAEEFSESCDFEIKSYEDEGGIKYKEKYCTVCGYVAEKWRVTPEIKQVTPDTQGHTGEYKEQTGFTATVACPDVYISGLEEGKSEEESLKEGLDVTLNVRELLTNQVLTLSPESADYMDGCITYTWLVPKDISVEESACYAVEEVVARNVAENIEISESLDYKVYIVDPEIENQKANFIITGRDGYEVDAKYVEDIWYSNDGNKEDKLKVSIQGSALGGDAFKVNKFEEQIENGEPITIPCVNPITEPATGTYHISQIIETIKGILNIEHNETIYDFQYELPTDVEGRHVYKIEYEVSEKTFEKTIIVNIDNTVPELQSITYNGETTPVGSAGAESGYYSEDVRVVAVVKENNLKNEDELQFLTLHKEGTSDPIKFKKVGYELDSEKNKIYTFEAIADADGKYYVSGKILDKAESESGEIKEPEFMVDKTAPVVDIEFDRSDAKNDKYFNKTKTATIKVTEANFNPDDSAWAPTINQEVGTAQVEGWQSESENVYTKKITFSEDGIYSVSFSCKDKAGKDSNQVEVSQFVIDTKAPTISVDYEGGSVKNEIYFNTARKAKITFDDISFDQSLVNITKADDSDLNALPSVGSYSNSEHKYETTMNFENDGRYAFKITCEDLAGNVSEGYSSNVFVIDTTAPEIEISGVEDKSANNGAVEPIINSTDLNLKPEDIKVTLTGANNGQIATPQVVGDIKGGYTIKLNDIVHEKSADDLYTLVATVTDQAGNETEKKIQYSVNRFGSVYVLGDGTKRMIDGHYVTTPEDVVVTEINVDSLSYKDVSLTYDGSVKNLKEGKGYTTSDDTNDKGWHSISYIIDKKNFQSDGMYSVAVYSEDRATNKQSNKTKDAEIEFIVDMTAPSVVASGIENDGVYEEASHDFSINANDTIGVAEVKIYIDDEELESYTSEDLQETGGTEIITIPAKDDYQQIEIVCSDIAGNETRLNYNNVLVSEKASELINEGVIQKKIIDEDTPKAFTYRTLSWIAAITAIALAGVLIVAGAFIYKKYKVKK